MTLEYQKLNVSAEKKSQSLSQKNTASTVASAMFFRLPRFNSHSHALHSHSHPMYDHIPIPMEIPWDPYLPLSHAHL